jgi:lysophospholipase L1-like esterase
MEGRVRRFLALGDSYTIGEGVDPADRWPSQLHASLTASGIEIAEPELIAQTGWATDELQAAIKSIDPKGPYDLVSLLIGVNNQFRGRLLGEYRAQFRKLVDTALKLAGGRPKRLLILSIPDWSVTPFAEDRDRAATATQLDKFNDVSRKEAAERWARYIDVTTVSRKYGHLPEYLALDGLHPSGRMYAEWARLVEPEALKGLGIATG